MNGACRSTGHLGGRVAIGTSWRARDGFRTRVDVVTVDSMLPKKLMLVDDHSVVRAGVRAVFESVPDIDIEVEATNGQEALELLRVRSVDGILLDLSMPDRSGLDVLRRIRSDQIHVPVLVFSMHAEDQYARNVLKAGANGYFTKGGSAEELVDAVRAVLAGKSYVSASVAQQLAASIAGYGTVVSPHEQLTPREFEVYIKLASGMNGASIAAELFLSAKTVATHRASILWKMSLKTTADLTYYAIKNHLIE